ncbi:hypothetical protein KIH27_18530 [Mycobacterium sp. M1]|uniref:Chromosome partition protein Smc n=1 Tax=Mycolicibacter acidiphilus TaxID=2835306 RepID=A0ABS5RMZ7_9MYCO|nr:hypothetical protein [Mycolicibacter acidiphilus]MBS9535586.1 hypothetical protein [Mycolicibacter acidiphilus]
MSETPAMDLTREPCTYPGCTRPRRPDPTTGRPTRYCEQADDDGGPVHNRVTAWKARQAQQSTVDTQDPPGVAAPVSLARATLEQHLTELPDKLAEQRRYLDALLDTLRTASDLEAAGAEVEDAHRDALAKVVDAERRAADAERIARAATARAEHAERDRAEADAIAADALTEAAQIRDAAQAQLHQVQAAAEAEVTQARSELAAANEKHAATTTQHQAELQQARDEATEARAAAAAARTALDAAETQAADAITQLRADVESARSQAGAAAAAATAARVELATATAETRLVQQIAVSDREALTAIRQELDRQRTEFQTERDAQRAAHAEQVAQLTHIAEERAQALTAALTAAHEVAETYRAQLKDLERPSPRRKSTPQT